MLKTVTNIDKTPKNIINFKIPLKFLKSFRVLDDHILMLNNNIGAIKKARQNIVAQYSLF